MKDIAIIGIGLTLPYADNLEEFWEILKSGVDCLREMPIHRQLDMELYYQANKQEVSDCDIPMGSYLDHVDFFDYKFFGMAYDKAVMLEPAQRLLFQTIWKTIEDAGYTKAKISNSNTAIYLGCSNSEEYKSYGILSENYNLYRPVNTEVISDYFNWKGISVKINTVCSSSLVSVHHACQALENNEVDMAIAGGIRLGLLPLNNTEIGVESSDGRTRPFDSSSEGFGGGEGVVTILLKELKKAERDKDIIHAVIKGSACNQDGATVSISAPNREAQTQVIRNAWENAGIDPTTITYIEAHGTGTELGDVVELEGITKAFEGDTMRRQFCGIGSVKSNYGHMEATAGLLGLVKAVLALKNKIIPPTLHFSNPNKYITFPLSPMYVNIHKTQWEQEDSIYRCGVSSFGFTGTNSHIVLERASESDKRGSDNNLPSSYILTISAKSKKALDRLVTNYINFNYENRSLNDVCYTANACRDHYNHRLAVIFTNKEELVSKLTSYREKRSYFDDGIYYGQVMDRKDTESSWEEVTTNTNLSWKEITRHYIEGKAIPWDNIYEKMDVRRISVFPYTFDKTKCWIDVLKDKFYETTKEYYTLSLEEAPSKEFYNDMKTTRVVLLFGSTTGRDLARYLKEKGVSIVEVWLSSSFKKQNEASFECGKSTSDFEQLFNNIELSDSTEFIFDVCYWEENKTLLENSKGITDGLQYVYNFSQVLGKQSMSRCMLNFVTFNVFSVDDKEQNYGSGNAAFMGFGKALQGEYHNITCKFIDTDNDLDSVWKELHAVSRDYLVVYRKGKRYIQYLERKDIQISKPYVFNSEGVYIIAGGLGNIGIEIANAIAYWGAKHIAIISRRTLLDRKDWERALLDLEQYDSKDIQIIRRLIELENLGCKIHLYSGDITDSHRVDIIIKDCVNKYHKINGVFQCTGIGVGQSGMPISAGTVDIFNSSISSKITGTCNLLAAVNDFDYDFFTVLSSPISITGGLDSSGYITANAFLDALPDYGRCKNKNIVVLSLAPYKKTIRQYDTEFQQEMHLFKPMDTRAILKALEDELAQPSGYLLAGKVNYGSYLFKMTEILPFQFSLRILEENNRYECSQKIGNRNEREIKQIQIIGDEGDSLNDTDRKIIYIVCSYLGYDKISMTENFYEVGGDSLIALKVISHINEALGIQAVVSDILKNPEIHCFLHTIKEKYMSSSSKKVDNEIENRKQEYYPVSSSQKRLYLLNQIEQGISGWNISYIMEITEGKFNKEKLETAFSMLIKRHEALRTSFHLKKGEVVQKVHDYIEFFVEFVNNVTDLNSYISRLVEPFNLGQTPLIRAMVLTTEENKSYYLFSLHHIISDEITMGIIMRELMALYQGDVLSNEYAQFGEYSLLQQEEFRSGVYQREEDYWLQIFAKKLANQKLEALYDGTEKNLSGGGRIHFQLDKDISSQIKRYSRHCNMMSYWYLMTVFQILLSKYLNSQDVVTGVTTTGRHYARFDNTVGMFVNVLPLRTFVDKRLTFHELMLVVKENIITAYEHQKYPYDKLIEKIQEIYGYILEVNISFQMHKLLFDDVDFAGNLKLKPYDYPYKASNQDILLEFYEKDNNMIFDLTYSTAKFTKKTMEVFISDFKDLIQKVLANPSVSVQKLTVDLEGQVNDMLLDFVKPF